jgi:hypothetical protein
MGLGAAVTEALGLSGWQPVEGWMKRREDLIPLNIPKPATKLPGQTYVLCINTLQSIPAPLLQISNTWPQNLSQCQIQLQ